MNTFLDRETAGKSGPKGLLVSGPTYSILPQLITAPTVSLPPT